MAVTATPVFPQAIATTTYPVTTAFAAAFTAGPNGSKIDSIGAVNTSTIADLLLSLTASAAGQIGAVSIAANAGLSSAVAATDVLRSSAFAFLSYDSLGNRCLYLAPNAVLYAKGTASQILFIQAENF